MAFASISSAYARYFEDAPCRLSRGVEIRHARRCLLCAYLISFSYTRHTRFHSGALDCRRDAATHFDELTLRFPTPAARVYQPPYTHHFTARAIRPQPAHEQKAAFFRAAPLYGPATRDITGSRGRSAEKVGHAASLITFAISL